MLATIVVTNYYKKKLPNCPSEELYWFLFPSAMDDSVCLLVSFLIFNISILISPKPVFNLHLFDYKWGRICLVKLVVICISPFKVI